VFLIEMTRKNISIPKVLSFSWLRAKGFESLFQQLKHQRLKIFLELSGKVYPDLVKVFFTNLEFKNNVLLLTNKGICMEINKKAWKDVVRIKARGVKVRKGETGVVQEFNKVQYYGQCLRNPTAEIKHFRSNDFPHVLYRLWLIGMVASHLEVITRRCRTRITWWWPCDVISKDGIPLV